MHKTLNEIYINLHAQNQYAQTIAIEDILEEYYPDSQLANNTQPNQGETNNEI